MLRSPFGRAARVALPERSMWMLLALACSTASDEMDPPAPTDTGPGDDGVDTASEKRCEALPPLPPLPPSAEPLPGWMDAEDFAFDAEGNVLFVNGQDLVAQRLDGSLTVIVPGVAAGTAGTRFLPDGEHLMICDVGDGALLSVDVNTGDVEVVLGGLEYPNGLEVDPDGHVYVSEEVAGTVRRVDPSTGEDEVVAEHLYRPNGLRYRASDATLFIGSCGGGYVWAVTKDGSGGWSAPRVAVETPVAPGAPCEDAAVGDACGAPGGYLGACAEDGRGGLECASEVDVAPCAGLPDGAPCTTERFGNPILSQCVPATQWAAAFCPGSAGERVAACAKQPPGSACEVDGLPETCTMSWQQVPVCYARSEALADKREGCKGKALYDDCVSDSDLLSYVGQCVELVAEDGAGLGCTPLGVDGDGTHGYLDGLNLDECGNLYVTELRPSTVWRFTDAGGEAEEVYAGGMTGWISNLHWGSGVGGWEPQVLYGSERSDGMLLGFDLGVHGEPDAFPGG